MLTDALSEGGLAVPRIINERSEELLKKLHHGSSVANPIDFLATGTAEQLGTIIDYCENYFDQIDGMIVIFGSPGLFPVFGVYKVLDEKMRTCSKPVFPVLPSIINARDEINEFQGKGHINFPDEVSLGRALAKIYRPIPDIPESPVTDTINREIINSVINISDDGFLTPEKTCDLLNAVKINSVPQGVATTLQEAYEIAGRMKYPVVMKVIGPVHKSDIGGVALNIKDKRTVEKEFVRMMKLQGVKGILIQAMVSGTELFAGIKYEPGFGSLIMCGLGGIFVEVMKDVQTGLAPLSLKEAVEMIRNLRGYPVLKGARGRPPVDEIIFAEILVKLSLLSVMAPEIKEMDINPLTGNGNRIVAVDSRVRIQK